MFVLMCLYLHSLHLNLLEGVAFWKRDTTFLKLTGKWTADWRWGSSDVQFSCSSFYYEKLPTEPSTFLRTKIIQLKVANLSERKYLMLSSASWKFLLPVATTSSVCKAFYLGWSKPDAPRVTLIFLINSWRCSWWNWTLYNAWVQLSEWSVCPFFSALCLVF